jgi:hypothetical protein
MEIQVPIPVTFHVKMETDRALILTDIAVDDNVIVKEGVIPKMLINVTDHNNGFIESWVLQQRIKEEKMQNVEEAKRELLMLATG